MRVLVTGGAGFIGSHFVRRLAAAGVDVVVLDKLTSAGSLANLEGVEHTFVQGDVADPVTVTGAGEGCEAVVNFAVASYVDRSILAAGEFIRTDVVGTHVLLEWARRAGVPFVHVSTDEVYGDMRPGVAASEDDPLRPSSPYAASKAGGDLQVLAHVRTHGVDARIVRGSSTYGPNQHPEKPIPLFVTNALAGEPLLLYAGGRQTRAWLHVADHCAAIELVLSAGEPGGVYNVGGGEELETAEVARRILALAGAEDSLLRHVDEPPGQARRHALDTSRIQGLGWRPERRFEEGLADTVAWYRDSRSWWEPLKAGQHRRYHDRQHAERLGA